MLKEEGGSVCQMYYMVLVGDKEKLAESQDLIGWRRFLEGMISKEMVVIQQEYQDLRGACGTPETPTSWAKGLFFCLI